MQEGRTSQQTADKTRLRIALREQRSAWARMPRQQRDRLAELALRRLFDHPRFTQARCIALYLATEEEFDPSPIALHAGPRGVTLCYPRIAQRRPPVLSFHVLNPASSPSGAPLGPSGPSGIRQPAADQPPAPPIDLFVVPGLGFTPAGHRLGQGGGYYDAALRAQPWAFRVAPCHDFQLLPELPHDEHDEPVDLIVTPSGAHETGARVPPGRTDGKAGVAEPAKEDLQ